MTSDLPIFRADQVGSLLRPEALLEARRAHAAGSLPDAALRDLEDEAIRAVVRMQEDVGLPVVTDGEFRRGTYSDAFTTQDISGISVEMTEDQGWSASQKHGHRTARRIPKVVDRIEWTGGANARDFAFVQGLTSRVAKATLPGPAYVHYRSGRENISREAYPDLDNFWADMVTAYHKEMASLAEAGCRWLQIDETSLVKLGDERARALLKDRGDDWRDLLRIYVEVINAVVRGAPSTMKIGIHICRSQDPSWQANVSYGPIAHELFNDLDVGTYFLEFDDERAGGFEPLGAVPPGKQIVLGLVSSKRPQVEDLSFLKGRIEEAAKFLALDQLSISPQCGFSTSATSAVKLTHDQQRAKLARVVEAAKNVWGSVQT